MKQELWRALWRIKNRADIVRSAFTPVPLSEAEKGDDPDHFAIEGAMTTERTEETYRVPKAAVDDPASDYIVRGLSADYATVELFCLSCGHKFPGHAEDCHREVTVRLPLGWAEQQKARADSAEASLTLRTQEVTQIREERDSLGINMEMARASSRGWQDFFSGQPRDMPFKEPGTYAKNSQLNFAWCVGYDAARESDVFTALVSRADRTATRAETSERELAEARTALREYGRHTEDCKQGRCVHCGGWPRVKSGEDIVRHANDHLHVFKFSGCTCGLSALLSPSLEKKIEPQEEKK